MAKYCKINKCIKLKHIPNISDYITDKPCAMRALTSGRH